MKIEHLAVWVDHLETMKDFYIRYFGGTAGQKYTNATKCYTSYFLSFENGDTRIELMHRPDISPFDTQRGLNKGLAHFAVSVGTNDEVDRLTEQLRADGYTVYSEARTTGDGYYESVVLDPEGNYLEITA